MTQLPVSLPHVSFRAVLGASHDLPVVVAVGTVLLGLAYLFFGRRLFRLLVVVAGALLGAQLGLLAARAFSLPALWVAIPAALVVGGLAWPLWQVILFVLGGGVGALVTGEALVGATGYQDQLIYGLVAGFVLGGVVALLLFKAMSIGLTALFGALLVYLGSVALLAGHVPVVGRLPAMPLLSAAAIGILTLVGIVAQLAQGDPEVRRRRRREEAEARTKKKEDARAKDSYDRYLGG